MRRLATLSLVAVSLTGVAVFAAGPASASEYCVVCNSPDARYRCMTNDGRNGQGTDQRASLQCISQLAKGGGHESCSIDRSSTAPCLGVVKDVSLATLDGEPTLPQPVAAPPAARTPGEPEPRSPDDGGSSDASAPAGEPGVLEKTKQGLENAGSAVGDAAKKSWDCMSSLFKKC